ncbi:VanW family protein [Lentibacillus juripiscarius]|uniref:VanW family protein n=1 Tax=Lentibacillus juripiscarius TaxID=257446 RepID=A0ABW5V955_9BACI
MLTVFLSFLLASAPLSVMDDGETVDKLMKEDFELSYVDRLLIDDVKLKLQMDVLNEKIYQEPVNAKLDDDGDIISEKPGTALDRVKFRKLFRDYFYDGSPTQLTLPEQRVYPRVDSELLAQISEKTIGSYQTSFSPNNEERTRNIELAAEAIDNHVVFPGESFSFNETVGERTKEKGYQRAPVIIEGELAEDIGGGICQVSSTLYNAVDIDGMEIVERYSHSRSVPYVPSGRDATVSWHGPDFVFKNTYKRPILIRAWAENGMMTIQILSSEPS